MNDFNATEGHAKDDTVNIRIGITQTIILCLVILLSGCAIHQYDKKTGTEHIWGFGHMRMRIADPKEDVRALVGQTETFGIAVGSMQESKFATVGWQRQTRLLAIDQDTTIRFEWPNADLFNVRIGSEFPLPEPNTTPDHVSTPTHRNRTIKGDL